MMFGKLIASIGNNKIENKKLDNKSDSSSTTIIGKDQFDRYKLFSYEDNLLKINTSPVLGYEVGKRDGSKYLHR